MKQSRIFRILVMVIIILSLLIVAIPATPVLAASITLDPVKGPPGTVVTVTGTGFTAGHIIDIQFQWSSLGQTIVVPANGIFTASFTVPEKDPDASPYPYFLVQAWNYTTDSLQVTANFTMTGYAEITIDPEEGPVGTEVEISGEGFDSKEDIEVFWDDEDDELDIIDGDEKSDSVGEFEDTIIEIPESTAGEHKIIVIGKDSGNTAEAEFTVEPEITIDPTSGSSGIEVTVSGTGFGSRSDVTIYFNGKEVTDDTTDRDGSFTATFTVPEAAPGTHTIDAEDEDRNTATAEFTTAAKSAINPTTGKVGSAVTVTGTGFKANGTVVISFDNIQVAAVTADSSGAFSATFNAPPSTKGMHNITASDGLSTISSGTFEIQTTASLDQATGNVGTKLTITGNGFSGQVTVKYDDKVIATSTADSSGVFSTSVSAPASTKGDHTITISDDTSTITQTFTMESEAPPIPELLLPEPDTKPKEPIHLDWEDVTDPSPPVIYILQIATDKNFSKNSIVLEKAGLTDSEYTLTEEEKLEPAKKDAPYYWRVKAIDGASNESDWSKPRAFNTGFTFTMSGWLRYLLISLGALVLFIFGMWVGRRTAYY